MKFPETMVISGKSKSKPNKKQSIGRTVRDTRKGWLKNLKAGDEVAILRPSYTCPMITKIIKIESNGFMLVDSGLNLHKPRGLTFNTIGNQVTKYAKRGNTNTLSPVTDEIKLAIKKDDIVSDIYMTIDKFDQGKILLNDLELFLEYTKKFPTKPVIDKKRPA